MANRKSIPSVLVLEIEFSLLYQVHGLTTEGCGNRLNEFGVHLLPAYGKSVAGDDFEVLSNGPGMWMVQSRKRDREFILLRLRELLADTDATVTDLSSARLTVQVSGVSSRTFLKKGCPADIDSLESGDVISSVIGHLGATIHCMGDDFTVYVLQSFGTDFWEWCRLSTMEFNM